MLLAVPAILAQFSSVLMMYIDTAMVGHLGANPSASIGLVTTSTWILDGETRSDGHGKAAKNFEGARRVLRQGLSSIFIFSLVFALAGVAISPYLPAWLGGIMLGTLLINIIGCGSGLSLGAATILVRDVYSNLSALRRRRKAAQGQTSAAPSRTPLGLPDAEANASRQLLQTRLSIVGLLAVAVVVALSVRGTFINDLGFLSLGLRAVALLFPLSFALFLPGRIRPGRVVPAMVAGTAAMLLAKFLVLPADPIYYGLGLSLVILLSGLRTAKG